MDKFTRAQREPKKKNDRFTPTNSHKMAQFAFFGRVQRTEKCTHFTEQFGDTHICMDMFFQGRLGLSSQDL